MSFWRSRNHRAKKRHRCEYCGKIIEAGELYSRETGVYEWDFNDYCLCLRCVSIIPYFKDKYSFELGNFVDDVFNSDLLECPKCHGNNSREYYFAPDMQNIKLECDICGNTYVVDLSKQAIKKHFEGRR